MQAKEWLLVEKDEVEGHGNTSEQGTYEIVAEKINQAPVAVEEKQQVKENSPVPEEKGEAIETEQVPEVEERDEAIEETPTIKDSKTLHIKASPVWTRQTQPKLNEEVAWDDGAHSKVDEVCLTYTQNRVCSIQVTYSDSAVLLSPMHGTEGIMFNQLSVNSPIISVSGHYDWLKETSAVRDPKIYRVVRSLTFKTASGVTYGPYGLEIGSPFCYQTDNGVVGFHGKLAESYLSYLGVYVKSYATRAAK